MLGSVSRTRRPMDFAGDVHAPSALVERLLQALAVGSRESSGEGSDGHCVEEQGNCVACLWIDAVTGLRRLGLKEAATSCLTLRTNPP